jgi:hypothetical protein
MKVIATGKWSKTDKRWKMVVALRRRHASDAGATHAQTEHRPDAHQGSRPQPPENSRN